MSAAGRVLAVLAVLLLTPGASVAQPPPLEELDGAARRAVIARDAGSLLLLRGGLADTAAFGRSRPDLFPPAVPAEPRLPASGQREEIRAAWKRHLDYLLALDSLGDYHRRFWKLDGEERGESFLVTRAAFLASYRTALDVVDAFGPDPALDKVLDEPVPELGLPEGTWRGFKFRFLNAARAAEFASLELLARGLETPRHPEVRAAAEEDAAAVWRAGKGKGEVLTGRNALDVIKGAGLAAWFPVQAGVAEWMGDVKVRRVGVSLVSGEQIAALAPRLRPGDILLERREWYLSNVGLPGFWPHAALYVGTPEERRSFFAGEEAAAWVRSQGQVDGDLEGLLRDRYPEARQKSVTPDEAGHPPRVLEAMSEGVVFTTLEHSAAADSLAVLRPRLAPRDIAAVLVRAFGYSGRPYDFDFDFRTDATLVCTELVCKAFEPSDGNRGLTFPLETVLGRPVTSANSIARTFDEEAGSATRQLDLVFFLDGNEKAGKAVEATEDDFRRSWRRPKWHILVQAEPPGPGDQK